MTQGVIVMIVVGLESGAANRIRDADIAEGQVFGVVNRLSGQD